MDRNVRILSSRESLDCVLTANSPKIVFSFAQGIPIGIGKLLMWVFLFAMDKIHIQGRVVQSVIKLIED